MLALELIVSLLTVAAIVIARNGDSPKANRRDVAISYLDGHEITTSAAGGLAMTMGGFWVVATLLEVGFEVVADGSGTGEAFGETTREILGRMFAISPGVSSSYGMVARS